MKYKWEDATSYSRGDKERKITAWSINGNRLRIYITFAHRGCPGEWVMHCHPWFDTFELRVKTLGEAQEKAIELVENVICQCTDDLDRFKSV